MEKIFLTGAAERGIVYAHSFTEKRHERHAKEFHQPYYLRLTRSSEARAASHTAR
jgi:hypothetical protein